MIGKSVCRNKAKKSVQQKVCKMGKKKLCQYWIRTCTNSHNNFREVWTVYSTECSWIYFALELCQYVQRWGVSVVNSWNIFKNVSRKDGTEKKKICLDKRIKSWMCGLRIMCANLFSGFNRNIAELFLYTNDFYAYKRKYIAICNNELQVTRWWALKFIKIPCRYVLLLSS